MLNSRCSVVIWKAGHISNFVCDRNTLVPITAEDFPCVNRYSSAKDHDWKKPVLDSQLSSLKKTCQVEGARRITVMVSSR